MSFFKINLSLQRFLIWKAITSVSTFYDSVEVFVYANLQINFRKKMIQNNVLWVMSQQMAPKTTTKTKGYKINNRIRKIENNIYIYILYIF